MCVPEVPPRCRQRIEKREIDLPAMGMSRQRQDGSFRHGREHGRVMGQNDNRLAIRDLGDGSPWIGRSCRAVGRAGEPNPSTAGVDGMNVVFKNHDSGFFQLSPYMAPVVPPVMIAKNGDHALRRF